MYIEGVVMASEREKTAEERIAELEAALEAREMFTDVVRHDLLSDLGILRNSAELLMEEPKDSAEETETACVEAIYKSADKLVEFIQDLDYYLGMDPSKVEAETEVKDLNNILRDSVQGLDAKKIPLVRTIYDSSAEYLVKANGVLDSAFKNILQNAFKYGPDGGEVLVNITDAGDYWDAAVMDRGPGVPDKYKQNIFNRLERLQKEGVRGKGLGLAITKRAVEMHRGTVYVEDRPGGGSEFHVRIPKAEAFS